MTFYSVLSALLFLGSLRVLLVAIDTLQWADLFAAGCLTVLVFNDLLSTSHAIECKGLKYTLPLMLYDLANFVLLALAMIVLNPSKNLFDVDLPKIAAWFGPSAFWLLLALYWAGLIAWTRRAKIGGNIDDVLLGQLSVAVAFLLQWTISLTTWTIGLRVGPVIVFVYLILYITLIRPRLRRKAQNT